MSWWWYVAAALGLYVLLRVALAFRDEVDFRLSGVQPNRKGFWR